MCKNSKNILFAVLFLLIGVFSCKNPFKTTTDSEYFELKINHNIQRVMPNAHISLSWSEITVENYKSYKIERMLENDTAWTMIIEIKNEFLSSYTDTIWNDEDLFYRVGILDIEDNIIWANANTKIPSTTKIYIPDEFPTIQTAFNSDLIDGGDTIIVKPGLYQESISILEKDVFIFSTHGFKSTIITPTHPDSANVSERVVTIASGIIDGFTIRGGVAMNGVGGGVSISHSSTVQNCFIQRNTAQTGGGVYITDNGNFYNNIVVGDSLSYADGLIYISNGHGKIINNTTVNYSPFVDEVVINGDCSGLIFRNNLVYNFIKDINVRFQNGSQINDIILDYSLFSTDVGIDGTNIVENPEFLHPVYFTLSESSPGIDAGHPDNNYLDVDGTRNDIGAYGGPNSKLILSSSGGIN